MSKKLKIMGSTLLGIVLVTVVFLVARQSMKLDKPPKDLPVKVEKHRHKTVYQKKSNEVTVTVDTED